MHDYIPTLIGLPLAALFATWEWRLQRRDARKLNPPPATGPRGAAGDSGASNV